MTTPYIDPIHQARGHIEVLDRVLAVPNQVGGGDVNLTVPGQEAWEVIAAAATFTATAAAANRVPSLVIDDETLPYFSMPLGLTIVASGLQAFSFAHMGFIPPVVANQAAVIPLPNGLIIPPGHRLRLVTTGIQAGDQWSGLALFLRVRTLRGVGAQLAYDQEFGLDLAEAAVASPLL